MRNRKPVLALSLPYPALALPIELIQVMSRHSHICRSMQILKQKKIYLKEWNEAAHLPLAAS